jgi:hypothetical protein
MLVGFGQMLTKVVMPWASTSIQRKCNTHWHVAWILQKIFRTCTIAERIGVLALSAPRVRVPAFGGYVIAMELSILPEVINLAFELSSFQYNTTSPIAPAFTNLQSRSKLHPITTTATLTMSDKLMDTEPGGEQTQYEGVHTFIEPHAKQGGQLAGMSLPLLLSISHLNPPISTLLTHAQATPTAHPSTSRPAATPAHQTRKASRQPTRFGTDRVSKRAAREARRRRARGRRMKGVGLVARPRWMRRRIVRRRRGGNRGMVGIRIWTGTLGLSVGMMRPVMIESSVGSCSRWHGLE